ncbi:hypothetical protein VLK31_25660 [Variovorax sp. H27-G14]|uniref:hypothetical protein n=1 Tax=Variovorax sp. H27-G14 TaxID=3111914 RepID=UPI0038FC4295
MNEPTLWLDQLRTDLQFISGPYQFSNQGERYLAVGRWHNYAGLALGLPGSPTSDVGEWFVKLGEADVAISALTRLRNRPYPVTEVLTPEKLKKIVAHRHIEAIAALIPLKLVLDETSRVWQRLEGVQNLRGPFDGGWSWRPRLESILDFFPGGLPSMLERLRELIHPASNGGFPKTDAQREECLELQNILNETVDICRELSLNKTRLPLNAVDGMNHRQRRLLQVRRDEYEWKRQPKKVCDRWLRLSKSVLKQHKNIYATYCVLYLDNYDATSKPAINNGREPELVAKLIALADDLIREIKMIAIGVAYFKKLDWTPHLGNFYTLILLHSEEYDQSTGATIFHLVENFWIRNAGAKIASHLATPRKSRPATDSLRINDAIQFRIFEQVLIFLTMSAQQARIRYDGKLERFRCERLQIERHSSSKSPWTKGLLNEIRMERGGLGRADPLDPRNKGPFVTAILMMIDRWLNKFIRTNGKPLFEISHANGIQTLKAGGLGQQLITLFRAIPLLVGNTVNANPSLGGWYPLHHSELQQEPKTQLFLTLNHLLDARGQTDQTGWYQVHPEVSVPLLNNWLRGLRKIFQLRFKAKIDYWNQTAHRTHRNLHRVMVNEFFKEHDNCLILQFDLSQSSLGPVVLPSELTKDHRRFGDTLQHWVKRLEAQRLPTARIVVRIDVDPQTQELIGRGLLLMNSKANWFEIYALISGEWEQVEKSVLREPAAPSQSSPTTFTLSHLLPPPSAPRFKHFYYTSNSYILDPAARVRRRVAMLGLIPQIERFNFEHFGWSMFVWNFDEKGRSRIIMHAE